MTKRIFAQRFAAACVLAFVGAALSSAVGCSGNVSCWSSQEGDGNEQVFKWDRCSDNVDRGLSCKRADGATSFTCTCMSAGASGNTFDGGANPYDEHPMIPIPPVTSTRVLASYDFINAQCGWKLRPQGI